LIAEDHHISNLYISKLIKSFGKEIIRVSSGLDAVEACKNNPDIDLILMDVQMPNWMVTRPPDLFAPSTSTLSSLFKRPWV